MAFTMPPPSAGAESYQSGVLANGDAVTVIVSDVVDGSPDELDQAALDRKRQELRRTIGSAYYEQLLADLKTRSQIERKPLSDSLPDY